MPSGTDQALPYRGLTAVNASRGIAGAAAVQLLAGLGARVIRIEEPLAADGTSPSRGVSLGWDAHGDLFRHLGRGSESVLLDLEGDSGLAALTRIAQMADVVVEDERPADPRGVRAAVLEGRERGGSFAHVSITPFGLSGPWIDLEGPSLVVFAMSGLMDFVGEPEREPLQVPVWLVQEHVGVAAFTAMTSAIPLDGSAIGSHDIEVSALDVLANSHCFGISLASYIGERARRAGSRFLDGYPFTVLKCKDGYIGIVVPQTHWDVFCLWIERPDLITDPRFEDRPQRREHADELDEILVEWAANLTRDELYREGQIRHLPFGAVFTVADELNSAQLAERNFFQVEGSLRFAGLPYVLDGVRPSLTPAPLPGQHTDTVAPEPSPSVVDGGATARTPLRITEQQPPLAGVRVLELSTAWAGPFAGRLLGDLGAEVIKVESRRRLDTRGSARPVPGRRYPDDDPGEEPWNRAYRFDERNRSKLSLAMELNHPGGRDAFLRLAAASDIVIENFSPRVLPQFGLSYPELVEVKPDLIMLSLSGFGQTGPERENVAYGPTVEQVSGLASLLGYLDGPPISSGLFLPDVLAAMVGAGVVMSALRSRARTGRGMYVDLAEAEVIRWMAGHVLLAAQAGHEASTSRYGNRHPVFVPHNVFPCAGEDRWVAIAVESDEQWQRLASAIGRADLARRYAGTDDRAHAVDEIEEAISAWTSDRDRREVESRLRSLRIPASEVAHVDEVLENPHLKSRGTFSLHPLEGSRPREISGGLWTIDGWRPGLRAPAPRLGEHNEYVLGRVAGMTQTEIADLRAAGIIGTLPMELEDA